MCSCKRQPISVSGFDFCVGAWVSRVWAYGRVTECYLPQQARISTFRHVAHYRAATFRIAVSSMYFRAGGLDSKAHRRSRSGIHAYLHTSLRNQTVSQKIEWSKRRARCCGEATSAYADLGSVFVVPRVPASGQQKRKITGGSQNSWACKEAPRISWNRLPSSELTKSCVKSVHSP